MQLNPGCDSMPPLWGVRVPLANAIRPPRTKSPIGGIGCLLIIDVRRQDLLAVRSCFEWCDKLSLIAFARDAHLERTELRPFLDCSVQSIVGRRSVNFVSGKAFSSLRKQQCQSRSRQAVDGFLSKTRRL
jgi:hypothetical protein